MPQDIRATVRDSNLVYRITAKIFEIKNCAFYAIGQNIAI
jgi:hypothetical protein